MSLQDYAKMLRARWVTVCVTIAVAVMAAVAFSLLTTPLYQASTRLFVSASSVSSAAEMYQGNLSSQGRVLSYTQVLMSEALAQRTIDKLGLDMKPETLQAQIKATAKSDTVLIKVEALDQSPVGARDIANTLSDEFVVMVRELETPENGASPAARVVVLQRASVPAKPVIPKTSRNIGIGLVLGTVLGIGLAVVRGLLDNTLKDREAVEEITGTGLVGSIPFDKERRTEPAISFDGDNFASAEAFRKLRTNLQFLAVDNPPRVIVVVSSMPHEGKTITAINLALALAEAEHNVVLVDGDMRRPMLDKHFDLIGSVGFSTVLSGQATVEEALQKTRFPGLTVLTSGPVPPNPSELLGSLAAQKVLNELRTSFDYVIVDSSPLLAVTDAAVLSANSDGVLIMARYGETKREQLAHAVGSLEDVGAHLLGAVFTMVPGRGNTSYSYYGSYGTYGTPHSTPQESHTEPTAPNSSVSEPEIVAQSAGRRHRLEDPE